MVLGIGNRNAGLSGISNIKKVVPGFRILPYIVTDTVDPVFLSPDMSTRVQWN